DRSLTRLQFEANFVKGCVDGWPRNAIAGPSFVCIRVRRHFVRSPLKVDIKASCQSCHIDNRPVQKARQRSCEALHGYVGPYAAPLRTARNAGSETLRRL